MPLKRVRVGGGQLYVSNFRKEIVVPLTFIEIVTENRWINVHPVTIHFRGDTEFGRKISFMPKTRVMFFWSSHPVVGELRRMVAARQREQGMRRGRSGPRQPGGGEKTASRGRGHGRDRDERHKERSKKRFAQRQSDVPPKHAPKRGSPSPRVRGEGRGEGASRNARIVRMPQHGSAWLRTGSRSEGDVFLRRRADRHRDAGRDQHAR